MYKYRDQFLRRPESENDVRRKETQKQIEENQLVKDWRNREEELGLDKRYIPIEKPEKDVYHYPEERSISPNREISNEILKKEKKTKKLLERANKVKKYMPEYTENDIQMNASANPISFEKTLIKAEKRA